MQAQLSCEVSSNLPAMLSTYALVVILGLLVLGDPAVGQESPALPVTYSATVLPGDGGGCPTTDQRAATISAINTDIRTLLQCEVVPLLAGSSQTYDRCGSSGWTRIAYLNTSDPCQQCPPNWSLRSDPKRSCVRSNPTTCDSAAFSAGDLQYSQVCGQIAAYQVGYPDGFGHGPDDIDSYSVDGVSVTYGNPRQHIWTFATAPDELLTGRYTCPCSNTGNPTTEFDIPSFVGDDYFCETGVPPGERVSREHFILYPEDPLWDGNECGPTSACCTFNDPPWFNKQLSQPTTDDLEVRICGSESLADENTAVELLEIYVK